MSDPIQPTHEHGVPMCSEQCPSYDGKRCEVLGFRVRTGCPCEPAIRAMIVKPTPNAPGIPPPGGVPAARPEGEPGGAAVFVDWEAVADHFAHEAAMSRWPLLTTRERANRRAAWWKQIVSEHTHPAPEGLAARMRGYVEADKPGVDDCRCDQCQFERSDILADATPAAVAALDRAAAENVALRAFAEAFAATAEAAVEAHESRGRGGQQVGFHGDFAHAPPSAVNRLRWWAARAREALKGVAP